MANIPNLGILWTFLLYSVYLVQASEEDLLDFDFSDLKEVDWSYDAPENSNNPITDNVPIAKPLYDNTDDNVADISKENQVKQTALPWHDRVLRKALAKVLTNKTQRQKFLEILPILRVLNKQQKFALSALISAQINAKNGEELKLDQVRRMFGDDKKLLIPIVYDIANLVRNSAKKYITYNYDIADDLTNFSKFPADNHNMELSTSDFVEKNQNIDISSLALESNQSNNNKNSMQDFLSKQQQTSNTAFDPKSINEEILSMYMKDMLENHKKHISNDTNARSKRSVGTEEFVHKLIRSIPSSINEEDLLKATIGRSIKLNTTIFSTSKESKTLADEENESTKGLLPISKLSSSTKPIETYQFIEDLALASLNETDTRYAEPEYEENVDENDGQDKDIEKHDNDEILPKPEELISKPRIRIRKITAPISAKVMSSKRKRVSSRVKAKQDHKANVPPPRNCERFTTSMCIKTDDYPLEQIMGSIRRHRNAMVALLAEYNDKWNSIDENDEFNEYTYNKKRREDEQPISGNGMCQSTVRYARPQKARSAAGEWKYIINTDQHTQTLRLEKCTNPQESCSYLNQNYRSHCAQVYNYHRLLSWDKNRGLHVDIFKVPTCCSCQVDGYRSKFTPFTDPKNQYTPVYNEDPYQKDVDYTEDIEEGDNDSDFDFDYLKRGNNAFDAKEVLLGSRKIRKKVSKPTMGPYLSPPGNEHNNHNAYVHMYEPDPEKTPDIVNPSLSLSNSINFLKDLTRRRPYKGYKEARADQEYSPSETEQKRTPISATPETIVGSPVSALRPSQPVPVPFIPSLPHPQSQIQSVSTALIPMPTKHYLQNKQPPLQELQQQIQENLEEEQHHQPEEMQQLYQSTISRPERIEQMYNYQLEKFPNTKPLSTYRTRSHQHLSQIKRPVYQQLAQPQQQRLLQQKQQQQQQQQKQVEQQNYQYHQQQQQQQRILQTIKPHNLRRHRNSRTYFL